jgi:phospholipid/cholesterol/gamma-HCH transport system ATP-binding protein
MIRFEKVVKRFGTRTILNSISFEAKAGEILFILGTSGTGKSVLLKNIVGLLRPDGGQIWVDGHEVSCLPEENYGEIRKICGMVFQQPALFDSLSIYENIAYGLRRHFHMSETEIEMRVRESLKLVNLNDITKKFPGEISYGMQKRVSLARTVALRPRILLFDEPTTGLDPITTNTVNQLILRLSRELQTTSLVVSHDMHCALDIADRIMVLDKGEVVENGTPAQLQKSVNPLVRDFLSEVTA